MVDSTFAYFSGVSGIRWEYTNDTSNVNNYAVYVKISNAATDGLIGNIGIIFSRSTNDIKKVFFIPAAEMRPDPSLMHLYVNYHGNLKLFAGTSRKSADPNLVYLRPTLHEYAFYLSGDPPNINGFEWNLNSTIGVTALYADFNCFLASVGMHNNNDPVNSVEMRIHVQPQGGSMTYVTTYNSGYEIVPVIERFIVDLSSQYVYEPYYS